AYAQAVQPALRSVRAQPARGGRLRALVRRARFCVAAGTIACGAASAKLPAVPAAAEAGQLLGRTSYGEAQESAVQQLAALRFIRRGQTWTRSDIPPAAGSPGCTQ